MTMMRHTLTMPPVPTATPLPNFQMTYETIGAARIAPSTAGTKMAPITPVDN